jgi:hypothetical protein
MTQHETSRPALDGFLRWGGMGLVLVCALVRAAVSYDPLPYWSMDPMQVQTPLVGLGAAQSQIVDTLAVLGAGMVLLGAARAGTLMVWPCVLALLGAAGVVLHSVALRTWHLDHARIGATWMSAALCGVAAAHACRDARVARLVIAVAMGASVLFVARGLVQVLVEHPETVREYRANREAFIAAQGWMPGSQSVAIFERRLNQPEALGWFGLSNVFASFAGAALVAYAGWTLRAFALRSRRELPDGWAGVLAIAALVAGAGLYLSRSKGGVGAAAIGLGVLALVALVCRGGSPGALRRRCSAGLGGAVAMGLIVLALGAVFARGLVGERIGELSLLFRSFYLEGATRIFASHPVFGVGPDGFKQAYLVAKPPISPEEVQSPHSVLFDFAATLGAFGLAWCGLFGWLVMRVGWGLVAQPRTAAAEPGAVAHRELRLDAWACALAPIAVVAAGIYLESATITPENALVRLVGMLAWAGVAIGTVALMRACATWLIPAAAAGVALAVHAQIEVTPVWPSSAGLFMVVLGAVAGAALGPARRGAGGGPRLLQIGVAGAVLALALVWARVGLAPTARWQGHLRAAAEAVSAVAQINVRLEALRRGHSPHDSPVEVAADLAHMTGLPVPTGEREFEFAMNALIYRRSSAAIEHLRQAAAAAPSSTATVEWLSRMHLVGAGAAGAVGLVDDGLAEGAEDAAAAHSGRYPSAASWNVLANVQMGRYELDRDTDHLYRAARVLEATDPMDPYGLQVPHRLARLYIRLREREKAAEWAGIALERDKLQRLDPLRRLPLAERRELEELRRASPPPS